MKDSVRKPPAPGTTGILSSDVSRTPSDAKKSGNKVHFKTAARVAQMGLSKKKSKVKKKWDQTKIVDQSLLIEKSSFQPIFKLGSKILFGLVLFGVVLLTTSIRKTFDIGL